MQTLTARYRVVTPLFMGAPETPEKAELNLRGIKGTVRFWWRALNYTTHPNIADLRKAEARLFGAAAEKDKKEGASRFKWRVTWEGGEPKPYTRGKKLPLAEPMGGLVYLAGQGLMEAGGRNGDLKRECFWATPEPVLVVELCAPGSLLHDGRDLTDDGRQITDSMQVLGLLGGIGSRKSRGFGSLCLDKLEVRDGPRAETVKSNGLAAIHGPTDLAGYEAQIRRLLPALGANSSAPLPEFPHFSPRSQIWLIARRTCTDVRILPNGKPSVRFEVANEPLALLNYVGRQMVRYRSYGAFPRNHQTRQIIPGRPREISVDWQEGERWREAPEGNFEPDHGWAYDPEGKYAKMHAERIAFGMPEGYNLPREYRGTPVASIKPKGRERRGSPFLIHIHPLAGGDYIAVATMLPARLTPDGEVDIVIRGRKDPVSRHMMDNFEETSAWTVLTNFVNGTLGPHGHKYKPDIPYFDTKKPLWP